MSREHPAGMLKHQALESFEKEVGLQDEDFKVDNSMGPSTQKLETLEEDPDYIRFAQIHAKILRRERPIAEEDLHFHDAWLANHPEDAA